MKIIAGDARRFIWTIGFKYLRNQAGAERIAAVGERQIVLEEDGTMGVQSLRILARDSVGPARRR
jgi:hypothetical protein